MANLPEWKTLGIQYSTFYKEKKSKKFNTVSSFSPPLCGIRTSKHNKYLSIYHRTH